MNRQDIDFSRLIGFEQAADAIDGAVDFRGDAIGARLGAKRGNEPIAPAGVLDRSRLVGFEQTKDASGEIDFRDEDLGSRLGAKRGNEPAGAAEDKAS